MSNFLIPAMGIFCLITSEPNPSYPKGKEPVQPIVVVENTTISGTGCTEEDVIVKPTVDSEGISFSMTYNSFEHEVTSETEGLGVNCDVTIALRLAPGYIILPATVDFEGHASVVDGGKAAVKAVIFYDADSSQRHVEKFIGPFEDNFSFSVPANMKEPIEIASEMPPCAGESVLLSIFTGLYGSKFGGSMTVRLANGNTELFTIARCKTVEATNN